MRDNISVHFGKWRICNGKWLWDRANSILIVYAANLLDPAVALKFRNHPEYFCNLKPILCRFINGKRNPVAVYWLHNSVSTVRQVTPARAHFPASAFYISLSLFFRLGVIYIIFYFASKLFNFPCIATAHHAVPPIRWHWAHHTADSKQAMAVSIVQEQIILKEITIDFCAVPLVDRAGIYLVNIFGPDTYFFISCPACAFLCAHSVIHHCFSIIVTRKLAQLQNGGYWLVYSATPSVLRSRWTKFIPRFRRRQMTLCFFKPQLRPTSLRFFKGGYCIGQLHTCIAEHYIKIAWGQRLGCQV